MNLSPGAPHKYVHTFAHTVAHIPAVSCSLHLRNSTSEI